MIFRTASAEETVALGERLGAFLRPGDIIALEGNLAAGKTTITKGIARALGVDDTITSPTFCLVSEYAGKMPLYHFDVYRLQGADDFANLGADEMLYGNGVCVIEWSEKIMEELPSRTIKIKIENEAREGSESDAHSARKISVENWPYENFGGAQ
ncbi:MAG: tRNA (adenosine(37)-N6)-threonylcarbamoyltransferase complex ATPase subunit type 1 TsaE [Treponema sp.]|nr:tRNA (adenosine(37)-N6)-threonylcarbamoyltransferase complex ATPase subunit type 1 TsaE [Treponema sp.]